MKRNFKKQHWEKIYQSKEDHTLGWYQRSADISLQLLSKIKAEPSQSFIDVGCGVSVLVDQLLALGFSDITLLDLSTTALKKLKNRLGEKGNIPDYLSDDITCYEFQRQFDLWHDRAVFHFLTDKTDRFHYMQNLLKSLSRNGRAIIGTFSPDGPNRCSGLDVVQYDEEKLSVELNSELVIEDIIKDVHIMPSGKAQKYNYFIIKHAG